MCRDQERVEGERWGGRKSLPSARTSAYDFRVDDRESMIRLSDRLACTHLPLSTSLSPWREFNGCNIYESRPDVGGGRRTRMSGTSYRSAYSSRQSLRSLFLSPSLSFAFFFLLLLAVPCVRAGARVSPFSNPPDRIVPFAPSSGSAATLPAIRHSISNFALAIRAIPRSFSTGSHTVGVPSFPAFLNPIPFSLCLSSSFFTRNPHSSSLEYPRKAPRGAHPQASSLAQTSVQIRASQSVFSAQLASFALRLARNSREDRKRRRRYTVPKVAYPVEAPARILGTGLTRYPSSRMENGKERKPRYLYENAILH